MNVEALEACAALVRRADPDRYFSALFAPAGVRPFLFALYALNHELARIGETVHEPMMGQIRLQWWREALAGARQGQPRRHDVVEAMAEVFSAHSLPSEPFDAMIEAREFDVSSDLFSNVDELVAYLDATSGNLMRLAARILSPEKSNDALALSLGVAYGLAGIMRAFRHHAARGKLYLPRDLVDRAASSPEAIIAPRNVEAVAQTNSVIASRADDFYRAGRSIGVDRSVLPAYLPAALVPLYLKDMKRRSFVPGQDVQIFRRQIALLAASMRGFR